MENKLVNLDTIETKDDFLVLQPEHYQIFESEFWVKQIQLHTILKTYGKGMNGYEFMLFMSKAKQYGLSIERWEIWGYKDHKKNIVMFAGRDWFLSLAQRNARYAGIASSEVCSNDKFEIDIANQKIVHQHTGINRWDIIGAYAIAYAKECMPVIEWVDLKTYDKWQFTWNSHKAEMIKKVAEVHALKKQFWVWWLYSDDEAPSMGMWDAKWITDGSDFLSENNTFVQDMFQKISDCTDIKELDLFASEIAKEKSKLSKNNVNDLLLKWGEKKKQLKDEQKKADLPTNETDTWEQAVS